MGGGFPPHAHADMEILSYVIDGGLAHRDSMGNGATIRPGEVQAMRAGTGVRHSEFNDSATDPVHFLQIWIVPERRGLPPAYGQVSLPQVAAGESRLDRIAGPGGGPQAVDIAADVTLWRATLAPGGTLALPVAPGRSLWVQAVRGSAEAAGTIMRAGDGLAVSDATELAMASEGGAELLVFDLGN
jgi:redox-sensitive bicupin YhaK (pirin superfamily)